MIDINTIELVIVDTAVRGKQLGADQIPRNLAAQRAHVRTESDMMPGLGETSERVEKTLNDLRAHAVDRATIGQYPKSTLHHYPVLRYATPDPFKAFEELDYRIGFEHVASESLVRGSYRADEMPHAAGYVQVA